MEKSKSLLLYLILFSFAFINFNCNTAEPIQNIVETGSRDYSWTIDTINSGSLQTYLTSIWGSSSKDVWICGHDANNLTKIYHFDGTEWKPRIDIPATYYIKSYSEVTGIDSNLVIFVGGAYFINNTPPPNFLDSSLIMKFTNNNWEINVVENSYHIYSVCITSENNIWAGDGKGNLIHFDGNNWTITKLGYENLLINEIEALNINNIYCNAHSERMIRPGEFYKADYLFHFNGVNWALEDSNISSKDFNRISHPTLLRNINRVLYGITDDALVKKVGDSWEIIKPDIYGQFNGTNENNIFLANQDFGVVHYNGKDWYRFNELPSLRYSGIAVFDNSAFLLASDGYKSFVVRGTKL